MVESVSRYKGFYVGRYEISLVTLDNGNVIAQSAAGKTSATAATAGTWYGFYEKAKAYGSSSRTLGVESQMIWGCQYDAMIRWMKNNNIDVNSTTPTDTARGKVASRNQTQTTGSSTSNDILNNVYDLLGNRREWTQQNSSNDVGVPSDRRSYRGGGSSIINTPAYRSGGRAPVVTETEVGSRLALYVKV